MINLFQKFLILCFIVLFSYSHDSEEKKLKKNETIKKIINYSGEKVLPVLSGICIAYKLGENKVPLFTKISPTIKNKINNAVHLLLAYYLFHNYFNKKQLIGKEINTNTNKQEEIRQIEQPLKKRYESESKDTETEQREKEMQEIVETLQKEIKEIEQELELPHQRSTFQESPAGASSGEREKGL